MSIPGWRAHESDALKVGILEDKRKRGDGDDEEPAVEAKRVKRYQKEEVTAKLTVVDRVNLMIAKSTITNAGNGLFAKRDFEAGEPITGYEGFLVDQKEARKLVKQKEDTHLRTLISQRYVLDGTKLADGALIDTENPLPQMLGKGGGAFVNDNGASGANAEFEFADDAFNRSVDDAIEREIKGGPINRSQYKPEGRIVFLLATKKIKKGNEIFVYYGEDFWKRRS